MRSFSILFVVIAVLPFAASAQTKPSAQPANPASTTAPPVSATAPAPFSDPGKVTGKRYTNKTLRLAVTFPDVWTVADDEFKTYVKNKGVDLALRPAKAANLDDQAMLNADFRRLTFLVTAYRSLPGTQQNATAHIAVEDIRKLDTNRPVNDGVDYLDLVRYQMSQIKLPLGYTYSETNAEKLGNNQYAYLDSTDRGVKTRLYVTVRNGYAILFSLVYSADDDLEAFRDVLARATFS